MEACIAMARLRLQEGPASGLAVPTPPAEDAGDKKKTKKKPAGAGAPHFQDKSLGQAQDLKISYA